MPTKASQKNKALRHPYGRKIPINSNSYLVRSKYGYWQVRPTPSRQYISDYYKSKYFDALEKINIEDKISTLETYVKNKKVLDVGCGDGRLLRVFQKHGWEVFGVEPSSRFKGNHNLNIFKGTVDQLKLNKKMDAVILNFVLEHLPDPIELLKIIKNKLIIKGGVLVIEVPNDFNDLQLICDISNHTGKYWLRFPDHLNYFSFKSLRKLLESLGFKILYQEASFPMELFLLMGDNYIKDKNLGPELHRKRLLFERNMIKAGRNDLKRRLYSKISELNIGRSIIMYAKNE